MLTVNSHPRQVCSGLSRRELIQAGGAGLFGLTVPQLLAAEQQSTGYAGGRAKSVLFLFLFGGPSQLSPWFQAAAVPTMPKTFMPPRLWSGIESMAARMRGDVVCICASRSAARLKGLLADE